MCDDGFWARLASQVEDWYLHRWHLMAVDQSVIGGFMNLGAAPQIRPSEWRLFGFANRYWNFMNLSSFI